MLVFAATALCSFSLLQRCARFHCHKAAVHNIINYDGSGSDDISDYNGDSDDGKRGASCNGGNESMALTVKTGKTTC